MAKDKMDKCENTQNVVVFGKHQEKRTAILFNPRCKQWSCDYCAELNKDYWIHNATRGTLLITMEGRDVQFVTLTSRGYATQNSSLYFFKQNWPKLNRRLKYNTNKWNKHFGYEWAYFLVPEHHKSGIAHFHLLAATNYNTKSTWKEWAWDTGFGYIVDVQPAIDPKQAANYISKYMHKGQGAEDWPKGFRRVRKSGNWPMSEEQPMEGWNWDTYKNEDTVWLEKMALIDMGWEVVDKRET